MKDLMQFKEKLDSVELLPKAILSLSTRNKTTGQTSGEKSVTLSFSVTLWHLICGAIIAFSALQIFGAFRALAARSRVKREVKTALQKEREKRSGA